MLNHILSISEVGNEEYLYLISTYWYKADKNFNCFYCKKEASASVRDKRKSCFTKKTKEVVNYNGVIKYFVCPSNFFNPAYSQLIDMFRLFQRGVLPFEGGLFDQPSKIIEVFSLLENLDAERNRDLERKQKWQTTQSKSNSRSMNKKQ